MVPLKKVRKDTSRPSDSTLRTLTLTSIPGSNDPIVRPSHSCDQQPGSSGRSATRARKYKSAASHAALWVQATCHPGYFVTFHHLCLIKHNSALEASPDIGPELMGNSSRSRMSVVFSTAHIREQANLDHCLGLDFRVDADMDHALALFWRCSDHHLQQGAGQQRSVLASASLDPISALQEGGHALH